MVLWVALVGVLTLWPMVGARKGALTQPPIMRAQSKGGRAKRGERRPGGGGFGGGVKRRPSETDKAVDREGPAVSAPTVVLSEQLVLNAVDHQRECDAGLATWPSVVQAGKATVVPTVAHTVQSDSLLSPGNEPFGTRALVHVTTAPVLAPEACSAIVEEAERVGATRGWASRYTLQDSSNELHAAELSASAALISDALPTIAATAAAALLPSLAPDGSHLRVYNSLVVR
eukprot:scaffold267341_cov30-Tisochrysis_lutea.AAC.2